MHDLSSEAASPRERDRVRVRYQPILGGLPGSCGRSPPMREQGGALVIQMFMATYENPSASGRCFGFRECWRWQDIYVELQGLLPNMKMPNPSPSRRCHFAASLSRDREVFAKRSESTSIWSHFRRCDSWA